jgi:hypothetical protein
VVVARVDGEQAADCFFADWSEGVTGPVGVYSYEVNLPAVVGGGRILRNYSVQHGTAYSGWQVGEWVTRIHVPGPFAQAVPLAREIKEAMAEHYFGQ